MVITNGRNVDEIIVYICLIGVVLFFFGANVVVVWLGHIPTLIVVDKRIQAARYQSRNLLPYITVSWVWIFQRIQ